jgi:hypothetical protein
MTQKIFPRNLTAQAAYQVAGNPVTTRLEDGVGNCYPGLEFDHRNLDRRFFPGLVFEFVAQGDADTLRTGARLVRLETRDSDLTPDPRNASDEEVEAANRLRADLGRESAVLSQGDWFIDSIEQNGVEISLAGASDGNSPLDGMVVWRLVRCLEPDVVKITLVRREKSTVKKRRTVPLIGWRRKFLETTTGVIKTVYQPGELTQSLCSPWQHDFRDCACDYWASNHPDIVLAQNPPGAPTDLPTGAPDVPARSLSSVDWLRSDRTPEAAAAALSTFSANRPYQMDHYEINQRWQELNIVLLGKEISNIFRPRIADLANPFDSPDELADNLEFLAGIEHVLVLEYLYAYFSLEDPKPLRKNPKWPTLVEDLTFAQHELLMVVVSEMRHLRWANQLLWELDHAGLIKRRDPVLKPALEVPTGTGGKRPRALRILDAESLESFINVERPSGTIEGQYARAYATLRGRSYPPTMYQLAERIIADGVDHFSRFRAIKTVLKPYFDIPSPPYLRNNLKPASPGDGRVKRVLGLYQEILEALGEAYEKGDLEDATFITQARLEMAEMDSEGQKLAHDNLGIPFF